MHYPIYRAWPAGRDELVAIVSETENAQTALEHFASEKPELAGYSLDSDSAGRLVLCPPMMRQYFYTYLDRIGDRGLVSA